MKTMSNTTARIYVGTYAKYNAGSIKGQWLDLEDYSDKDEFLTACAELHKDETDPEFMFQDMEGVPAGMASESHVNEDLWDWLALDADDRTILALYRAQGYDDATIDDARDAYSGTADSEADFAQTQAEETDSIPKDLPAWIVIDWQASWDGGLRFDYFTARDESGTLHFFRNC
jgi:antirestriction protein